jgi:hypothetical protein
MTVPLAPLPDTYAATRQALHVVAARVLGAARYLAVARMGLTVVPGGFGTPEFNGRHLSVVHGTLHDGDRSHELGLLGDACAFARVPLHATLPPALDIPAGPEQRVAVDRAAADALADWFAFSRELLAQFAGACPPSETPTDMQLWPEHFDLALDAGSEQCRATYGSSPGDHFIAEPYLYVGPWERRRGVFWDREFGAALTYRDVGREGDPLDFFLRGRELLAAG